MSSRSPAPPKSTSAALRQAAYISLILALIKFAAFFFTSSLVVLASFFDSLTDCIVSFVNGRVHEASKSGPDREHPFGHGGIEVLSSLIQGFVIAFFGLTLAVEAWQRLFSPLARPTRGVESYAWAALVLALSGLAGLGIEAYLRWMRRQTEARGERSLAIATDQAHYGGDAVANLISAAGLLAVWYSERQVLDAVFGLLAALFLLAASVPILRGSIRDVLHSEADPVLQQRIVDLAMAVDSRIVGIHRLRAREHGPSLFVDFHMTLPSQLSFETAHQVGEAVAQAIRAALPRADVLIHLDPDTEPEDDFWHPSYASRRTSNDSENA